MSVVNGGIVYVMSKQAQRDEVKERQYKNIDRCFIDDEPEAFILAESILYGHPTVENSEIMLSPEGLNDFEAISKFGLAYAYYVMADRAGDMRAKARMNWVKPNLEEGESEEIEEYIDRKYLKSYLTKCFYVPENYRKRLTGRDLIGG